MTNDITTTIKTETNMRQQGAAAKDESKYSSV
jgi:hypothetical protein